MSAVRSPRSPYNTRHELPLPPLPPSRPPNGGVLAWLQVAGSFCLYFNSWGLVNTYGAFQDIYRQTLLSSSSPSSISWIGTLQGFLLIAFGVLSGPLFDRGYLRVLVGTGTVLILFGLLMAGEVSDYSGIFLSMGVLVGMGTGCLFVPSAAVVAQYFDSRLPVASMLAAAGGSIGGIVYPIVIRRTIDAAGYAWACRILAFMVLGIQSVPLLLLKRRIPPPVKTRDMLDLSAFRDPTYTLFSVSLLVIFLGLDVPNFYLPSYATTQLGVDPSLAAYTLVILNSSSLIGRIVPGIVAQLAGALPVLHFCTFAAGVIVFFWIRADDMASLVAFILPFGVFAGAVAAMPSTALVELSPEDPGKLGARLGMALSFAGVGLLVGNPIAGALMQTRFSYAALQVFSGATMLMGYCVLGAAIAVSTMRAKARIAELEKGDISRSGRSIM